MNNGTISESARVPLQGSRVLYVFRGRALATMHLWWRRARTRRQLAELDNRMLADVGLDPVEASREAAKPFWRA